MPGKKFLSIEPCLGEINLTPYLSMCYNGVKEDNNHAEKTRKGSGCLSSGNERGLSDRCRGADLESSQKGMVEVGKQSNQSAMQEGEGRTRCGEVFNGADQIRWGDTQLPGKPLGILSHSRSHTATNDDKSQGREQEKEPSRKPRAGNGFRAGTSRPSHLKDREDRSERRKKCNGEIYAGGDSRNPLHEERDSRRNENSPRPQNISVGEEIRGKLWRGMGYPQKQPLDLILLGGETLGNRPGRELKLEWALNVAGQCKATGVPLFVKQLHINGKVSKDMNEWPKELQRRELPWL